MGSEAEKRALFADVFRRLYNRISIFVSLPIARSTGLPCSARFDELGARLAKPA